ncbi:MAG: hypothetical protein WBA57_08955 [Elainellaceae cyanobacterium]
MKWLWKTLGYSLIAFISILSIPFAFQFIVKPDICQISSTDPQKGSVQGNNIYNQIFGNEKCAPQQMTITIPVRKTVDSSSLARVDNSPEIISVVTVARESQSFYINRIDESQNGFNVAGDTCIAWKWSEQNQDLTLDLSLARNLQIYDSSIKKIIFIISLPAEFRQAKTSVAVKRAVFEGQAGEMLSIKLQEELPNLASGLRREYVSLSEPEQQSWAIGEPVLESVNDELSMLVEQGVGAYVDAPVREIQDNSDNIQAYEENMSQDSCEIPKEMTNEN